MQFNKILLKLKTVIEETKYNKDKVKFYHIINNKNIY